MFQAVSDNPADLQACARLYARGEYPQVPSPPHDPATRQKAAKIRLGYLSGEFRQQATAILMARLYELHDRESFEVIAIDNGVSDRSAMRARLEKTFDRWIDITELSDDQAAAAIRDARIDILVNLNGYFGKHRMGVFARRPAPLQVNYLGFPATLGAPYIDYILADRIVIPDGEQRFYDEQVVLLPGSYQSNDDHGRAIGPAPSRAEAGLPLAGFVFCNFNQSYKLTPQTYLPAGCGYLKQVEGSLLWLLAGPAAPGGKPGAGRAERHGRFGPVAHSFTPPTCRPTQPSGTIWRWPTCAWTACPTMPTPPPAMRIVGGRAGANPAGHAPFPAGWLPAC